MERRTLTVQIRMTPDERARLERHAAALGLPLGTWMRSVALRETTDVQQPRRTKKGTR